MAQQFKAHTALTQDLKLSPNTHCHSDQLTTAPEDPAPSSDIHRNRHSSAHTLYPTHTKHNLK